MRGVVDVLRRAGKMHEFRCGFEFVTELFHFGFEVILNRFDIVVGGFLDVFDGLRVCLTEVRHDLVQIRHRRIRKRGQFSKPCFGQGNHPSDFDLNAVVQQTRFGHDGAQGIDFGRITPV